MQYLYWGYAVLITFGILSTIASIGKQREPLTHGVSIASVIVSGVLVYLLIRAAGL